jgi:hypothetical protein
LGVKEDKEGVIDITIDIDTILGIVLGEFPNRGLKSRK